MQMWILGVGCEFSVNRSTTYVRHGALKTETHVKTSLGVDGS